MNVAAAAIVTPIILSLVAPAARAATDDDPFRGRTVTVYVGNPVGGAYDVYGRLLARHLGDHLPGHPTVVASNLVGGHSLTCANFLYNIAPRDGTAFGILEQNIGVDQVYGTPGAHFDATAFTWVGRMATNINTTFVWHDVPIRSIEDVERRETIFAGDAPDVAFYPTLLNAMIGTRFKVIRGFTGTQEIRLAMERGEVEASSSSLATLRTRVPDWLSEGRIRLIMQQSVERNPELPEIPAVAEFARTRADREVLGLLTTGAQIGRSFVAPPGLPADRADLLRRAFDATMQDPRLAAEARQLRLELAPAPGVAVQRIVAQSLDLSAEARARVREFQWR